MTVREIVKAYLEENGFDGLYWEDCGCFLDDLIPCGDRCDGCEAGHKIMGDDGDWMIGKKQ